MLEGRVTRAQIIWAKERLVIGRGDRKQTTLWTIASDGQRHRNRARHPEAGRVQANTPL
jgi:hypothetical protein